MARAIAGDATEASNGTGLQRFRRTVGDAPAEGHDKAAVGFEDADAVGTAISDVYSSGVLVDHDTFRSFALPGA
ncbi:MAG TPA: hypothetical protein VN758_13225 [Solirubrobacterales bacterium]|nr:hypothetical protein [Solirubrobacterales bacterium]